MILLPPACRPDGRGRPLGWAADGLTAFERLQAGIPLRIFDLLYGVKKNLRVLLQTIIKLAG